MLYDDIRPFKLACLQAAATLLAGMAAHDVNLGPPYSKADAAPACLKLAKELFKEALGADWPV
jgi:hypothetical protein